MYLNVALGVMLFILTQVIVFSSLVTFQHMVLGHVSLNAFKKKKNHICIFNFFFYTSLVH